MIGLTSMPSSFFGGLWHILRHNYPLFFEGLKFTLILAVVGTIFGLVISLMLVVFKTQKIDRFSHLSIRLLKRFTYRFSVFYVGFFRGTPMLVQAMIFYYGLGHLGIRIPILLAGLIIVSLNTAAYLTEVLRAGLLGVDVGQREAAESLGMSNAQVYRKILLPQALKNMVPAIGNELVVNIKDTAVLSVIGVAELFYMGRAVASATYRHYEAFIIVSIIYLLTVMVAVYALKYIALWFGKAAIDPLKSESEGILYD